MAPPETASVSNTNKRVHFDPGIDWDKEAKKSERTKEKVVVKWVIRVGMSKYCGKWDKKRKRMKLARKVFDVLHLKCRLRRNLESAATPRGPAQLIRRVLIDVGAPKEMPSLEEKLEWFCNQEFEFEELGRTIKKRLAFIGRNGVFRAHQNFARGEAKGDPDWYDVDEEKIISEGIQVYKDVGMPFVFPTQEQPRGEARESREDEARDMVAEPISEQQATERDERTKLPGEDESTKPQQNLLPSAIGTSPRWIRKLHTEL